MKVVDVILFANAGRLEYGSSPFGTAQERSAIAATRPSEVNAFAFILEDGRSIEITLKPDAGYMGGDALTISIEHPAGRDHQNRNTTIDVPR